jgi:hypothetical protein
MSWWSCRWSVPPALALKVRAPLRPSASEVPRPDNCQVALKLSEPVSVREKDLPPSVPLWLTALSSGWASPTNGRP